MASTLSPAVNETGFSSKPLVSVILFVRNGAPQVRRCVESILAQTYPHWELVVQDGVSTDETLSILRSYNDPRIQIVSEPDSGPSEGFWRALIRARGEILASCLADEELLPEALEDAVRTFQENPHIGAVTGDAYQINLNGDEIGIYTGSRFNIVDYLMTDYCPYWSSSFFSMRALRSTGLFEARWSDSSIEFEIWCRLATEYEIFYLPKKLSKYGIHSNQLSHAWERVEQELDSRIDIMRKHLFVPTGFFGDQAYLRDICILRQYVNLFIHFWHVNFHDNAMRIHAKIVEAGLLRQFETWRRQSGIHSAVVPEIPGMGEPAAPSFTGAVPMVLPPIMLAQEPPTKLDPMIRIYQKLLPVGLRRMIPRDLKQGLKRIFR